MLLIIPVQITKITLHDYGELNERLKNNSPNGRLCDGELKLSELLENNSPNELTPDGELKLNERLENNWPHGQTADGELLTPDGELIKQLGNNSPHGMTPDEMSNELLENNSATQVDGWRVK